MEMMPLAETFDIKCESMEVELPNIGPWEIANTEIVTIFSQEDVTKHEYNFETAETLVLQVEKTERYDTIGHTNASNEFAINQGKNSTWISPDSELKWSENGDGNAAEPLSPRNAFRSPCKKQANKSIKVVVWDQTQQQIKIEQGKTTNFEPPCKDNLFVVKSYYPGKENFKSSRNSNKNVALKRTSARNLTKSLKQKRHNPAGVPKTKNYQALLQSYITSKCTADFKVDALFQQEAETESNLSHASRSRSELDSGLDNMAGQPEPTAETEVASSSIIDPCNAEHAFTVDLGIVDDVAHFEQVECPVSVSPAITESTQPTVPSTRKSTSEISFDEQGKPRCTYTELIERALTESGGLTVSEIYQWISDHYPFYQPNDDRWKNSVRHNLSINPYFKKGDKARSGAGHLWTISEESRALRHAVRKKGNDSQELSMSIENETDRAVASILGQYNLAKANMEVGGQHGRAEEMDVCEDATVEPPLAESSDKKDESKVLETPTNTVFLDYANTGECAGHELTIDLGSVCIPEIGSIGFEELVASGRLIFIQTEDQDADKENMHRETSEMEQYMVSDFSELHNESQATERVSGQLISEAMTQEFLSNKPVGSMTPNYLESHNVHELQFESQMSTSSGSQDFMTLESIDPIALQDVMQVANGNGSSDNYSTMNGIGYEPRNIAFSCNYEQ